jgi:hypothetical protein
MLTVDVDVSRRDTTRAKAYALVGQLPLGIEPGRRGWVHRMMSLRIAESRRDRHAAAHIIRRCHYLARWPCPARTLMLSYLADLGTPHVAGLATVALLPGQFHVARALAVKQYETLSLVRVWRADDLSPDLAPNFTATMLRRVIRRLRSDWCKLKLREGGLRAPPRLLITYADPTLGHDGALYASAGATFCGHGKRGKFLFAWALVEELGEPLHAFGRQVAERGRCKHASLIGSGVLQDADADE